MRSVVLFTLTVLFFLLDASQVFATHVRAGEITAKRVGNGSSLRYELKFTGYYDMETGRTAAEQTTFVDFYVEGRFVRANRLGGMNGMINVGNNTTRNEYVVEHTFGSAGTFPISVKIDNRNNNVLNIGPPPTHNLNFFIQTTIVINANLGMNRTPVLLNAPIDLAAVGQRYIHNPAAFDADGDSLAYRLYRPMGTVDEGKSAYAFDYSHPHVTKPGSNENGSGPATFSIDPLTGDLTWDAPVEKGFYNVAFIVEEWRNGIPIGEIVRDMQIIVVDAPNNRPELTPAPELCIEAGETVRYTVKASDKDGNQLVLTSTSGVYTGNLVPNPLATFQAGAQTGNEITGLFSWNTDCAHIREEPYEVVFKVEDKAAPNTPNPALFKSLVDMTTLRIKVYAPAPKNLKAVGEDRNGVKGFLLSWDSYICKVPGAQIVVYRREGCTNYTPNGCETGLPSHLGYQVVARLDGEQTTYFDDNDGAGFAGGKSQSYRLVVRIPRHGAAATDAGRFVGGAESMPSAEACDNVPLNVPVLTNVTVDRTHISQGEVTIRWTRPQSTVGLAGPYQYRLYRANGLNGGSFGSTPIATINTSHQAGALDTLYVDKGLNTEENGYHYKLEYYVTKEGQLTLFDTAELASSVWLSQGGAAMNEIGLRWTASVPWDNQTGQIHRVYRKDASGNFNRIAEVNVGVGGFNFKDTGEDLYPNDGDISVVIGTNQTYCYKVETVGSYNSAQIRPDLLYNFSQEMCVTPSDTSRPCPPVLRIDALDCDNLNPTQFCGQDTYTNRLDWDYPARDGSGSTCDEELIIEYRVYYKRYESDEFKWVGSVEVPPSPPLRTFDHTNLTSVAGCYYVTAVNRFGAESEPSNIVCKEACPIIKFPNVFTPNGDGKNDIFRPFDCPAFIQGIEFRVFNRWGVKVWETNDVNINWDGRNSSGTDLPAGQYMFECVLFTDSIRKEGTPVRTKGWIQLIR